MAALSSTSLTPPTSSARNRHRSRRPRPPPGPLLLHLLLLLPFLLLAALTFLLLSATATAAAPSPSPALKRMGKGGDLSSMHKASAGGDPTGQTITVGGSGGTAVKINDKIGRGSFGAVHHATTADGAKVVYKRPHGGVSWGKHEVEATQAAKQYMAHDNNGMVQKLVGEQSLNSYLKQQKRATGGQTSTTPEAMSKEIMRQVGRQQDKAEYDHNDVAGRNIRVGKKKDGSAKFRLIDWGLATPAGASPRDDEHDAADVESFCRTRMAFRQGSWGAAGPRVYRRGTTVGGGGGGCSRPGAEKAVGAGKVGTARKA
ncbi:hypothetical protein DFJ73DRAFT_803227 [Zopfochytrium polystomum]|nr:hypothetical protein DFJ73DRAFT_803227 [Zopfochytrium polystomum]